MDLTRGFHPPAGASIGEMTRKKVLSAVALACFFAPGTVLYGQVANKIATGPRDILYADSQLFPSLNNSLYPGNTPLSAAVRSIPPENLDLTSLYDPNELPAGAASNSAGIVSPQKSETLQNMHFRWAPAFRESLLYTGIMHTFDLSLQPGLYRTAERSKVSFGSMGRRPRILDQYASFHGLQCRLAHTMENRADQ